MKTETEWAQAVCDEGARVQADRQRQIAKLNTENRELRARCENAAAMLEEDLGSTGILPIVAMLRAPLP